MVFSYFDHYDVNHHFCSIYWNYSFLDSYSVLKFAKQMTVL